MFLTMAQAYESEERWDLVNELYHDAVQSGGLMEALALLAMECITRSLPAEGKMRMLRSIVDNASALMKMNDPMEAQVEEHRLAMDQFDAWRGMGIVPKNKVPKYLVSNAGRDYQSPGGEFGTGVDAVPNPPVNVEGREEEHRRIARLEGMSLVV